MSVPMVSIHAWLLWLGVGLFIASSGLHAQESSRVSSATETAEKKNTQVKGGEPGWHPPLSKQFTSEQRRKECRKYNGKLIGYYENVYQVENCQRREILDEDLINRLTRSGKKVHPVENDTIVMLEEGPPVVGKTASSVNCKKLEGRYVIAGASEIHLVESCKRRPFPDWETFNSHRQDRSASQRAIIELSEEQFAELPMAEDPLESVLDKTYLRTMQIEAEADVIPIDEACRGLNGKLVSYYSKVYRIENCRKRELLNPEDSEAIKQTEQALPELSSEQWLSLPDGKPL